MSVRLRDFNRLVWFGDVLARAASSSSGGVRVEVNPDEAPASYLYDVHLRGPAAEMLRRLADGDPELLD